MNKEILKRKWSDISDKIQQRWTDLTEDDLQDIAGKYDKLVSKLQEYYNYDKEQAEEKLKEFYQENVAKAKKAVNYTSEQIANSGSSLNRLIKKAPWSIAAVTAIGGILVGMCLRNKLS